MAPSLSCSGLRCRSKQSKHSPKEPSRLVIGWAKVFLLALRPLSLVSRSTASGTPLSGSPPLLAHTRRSSASIPSHRIATQRKLGTFVYGIRVRIRLLYSSLGLLYPLMQPTHGEASSHPIVPLLSFPVNFALFLLSFFLSFSLLHPTSLQLITASTISLRLLNS